MTKTRWLLALPILLGSLVSVAEASSVRDRAGMFSPSAARKAEEQLNRIERVNRIPTTIETIESLDGQALLEVARREAERSRTEGLFILIPRKEHKIEVLSSRAYRNSMNIERLNTIREAFIDDFKQGRFDEGLMNGVLAIDSQVSSARGSNGSLRQGNAPLPGHRVPVNQRRGSGIGTLFSLGLLIVGGLLLMRVIGSIFGRGYASGPGTMMGGSGYGYGGGGPGYGGRGGFWSSVLGGIGGAMAGNWIYDQMSGRRHDSGPYVDSGALGGDDYSPSGGDDWSGGASAGGDWGGSDGGDWGGGGGDFGGGSDGGW